MAFLKNSASDYIEKSAPFNMALATLMRIDRLLEAITITSLQLINNSSQVDLARSLEMKRRLIWSLYVQSTPLLEKEQQDRLMTQFHNIKIKSTIGKQRTYDVEEEMQLDNWLIAIQDELQNNKYFMPSKKDPRYSWGQD